MSCPPEIAEIILKILRTGLLRIRSLAWSGQADRCAVEADHVHNLPDLLSDFSHEMLSYYWDVERPSYLAQIPEADLASWEGLWEELQPYANNVSRPTPIG
jgi:hypothetical protein